MFFCNSPCLFSKLNMDNYVSCYAFYGSLSLSHVHAFDCTQTNRYSFVHVKVSALVLKVAKDIKKD